jgi:hypothetical protein
MILTLVVGTISTSIVSGAAISDNDVVVKQNEISQFRKFMDSQKDSQYYIDRYNSQTEYKGWFDRYFPNITIEQAVGIDPIQEPKTTSQKESGDNNQYNENKQNTYVNKQAENVYSLQDVINNLQQENFRLQQELELAYSYTNPVISGLINGDLTYYIEPLPSWSSYNASIIDNALNGLDERGVKITRVYDESQADFIIWWVRDYGDERLGVAYSKTIATVGLGSSKCGTWQHFDDYAITETAWHEIGHVLGYGHSNDPNNIMYPTSETYLEHDVDVDILLPADWYYTVYICEPHRTQHYTFTTNNDDGTENPNDGFKLSVLPPETDVDEWVNNRVGSYYTCTDEIGTSWITISGTCDPVKEGSKIVIENDSGHPIIVKGHITSFDAQRDVDKDWFWDPTAYEYNPEYIQYIRSLF